MDGSQDFIAQDWQPQTALVRGGLERSPHQKTCEALYLTSGFVYDTAEEAMSPSKATANAIFTDVMATRP